jgi:Site-specific DNA methylase
MGLHRAGFDVTGVDIKPQPRYPFRFIQGDALNSPVRLSDFDLIWASPPCQAFTRARAIHGREHPNLVPQTRALLESSGRAWIIENVPGAPIRADFMLCGSQFGERRLKRHRWFECSWRPLGMAQPCDHADDIVSVFGHGGHIYHGVEDWRRVMGIEWMKRDEIAQAIPPAYSEHIGHYAMLALGAEGRGNPNEIPTKPRNVRGSESEEAR